jgi:gamma-glutamyl-gamma-aminobutyrate hydrolase PuuD
MNSDLRLKTMWRPTNSIQRKIVDWRLQQKAAQISAVILTVTLMNWSSLNCANANEPAHRKPLIGINLDLSETPKKEASIPIYYFEAIEQSGGIPVLLPPMPAADIPEIISKLDGLLLIGGDDYPPSMYGEKPEPKTSVMLPKRSDFDIALVKAALAMPELPILGVCAGCQILNIGSGGSLVQDIPSHHPESKIVHGGPYDAKVGPHRHKVSFEKDTLLSKLYGDAPLSVPTSHHQCVGKVGQDLHIAAKTEDGLPEAVERSGDRFIVGVQWHPERDYEHNKPLFTEFLRVASKNISGN